MSSKLDYLSKYAAAGDGDKKKKKKRKKPGVVGSSFKIVDGDIDVVLREDEIEANWEKYNALDEEKAVQVNVDDSAINDEAGEGGGETQKKDKNKKKTVGTWEVVADNGETGRHREGSGRKRKRHDKEQRDMSPPRRKRHDRVGDASPPRRKRHDSDGDASPPRRKRHDSDGDASPPRRKRHDSDGDASPPRRKRHDSDGDASPRRKRHDNDGDASPPRRKRHDSDGDASPPRRKRHDSDGDASPPRRKRHDSDGDASPPRRKRHDSDGDVASPPRRKRHDSDGDASPPRRKRHDSDGDASPPRRERHDREDGGGSGSSHKRRREGGGSAISGEKGQSEREKTASGYQAGLQSAKDFALAETAIRKKQQDQVADMAAVSGANAETVYRDRKGKKLDMLNEFMRQQASREGKEVAQKKEEYQWGLGTKQKEEAASMAQQLQDIKHEPFARSVNDSRLDAERRDEIRADDPMAAIFRKKKAKDRAKQGKPAKPEYKGPPPKPNRFNIPPGYRWDGVDRGNGWEEKRFQYQHSKGIKAADSYRWRTEDM